MAAVGGQQQERRRPEGGGNAVGQRGPQHGQHDLGRQIRLNATLADQAADYLPLEIPRRHRSSAPHDSPSSFLLCSRRT